MMYVLALAIWTHVWRVHDLIAPLRPLMIPWIAIVAALAVFLIDRTSARKIKHIKGPIPAMTLTLLGLAVLSVPAGLYPGRSAAFLVQDFVPTMLVMTLIAASIRSVRDVEWYAMVMMLGALVFVTFTFAFGRPGRDGRMGGFTYYDANDFALVLVCTLPFALFFVRSRVKRQRRLLALLGAILFVLTIMKTGSRGGFLAFLAVMGYVLIRYRHLSARVRLATVAGGFGLLMVLGSEAYWANMRTLLHPKDDYNWNEKEYGGRKLVWQRGFGYMIQNPALGVGLRNFPVAEGTSALALARGERGFGFKWSVAHNSFIEIGAELGILGLALFVAILATALRSLARVRPSGLAPPSAATREVGLAQMLLASLIGFIIAGFFVSAAYFAYLYVVLGLVIGLTKVVHRSHALAPARQRPEMWTPSPAVQGIGAHRARVG